MHAMWSKVLTLCLILGGAGLLLGQSAPPPAQSPGSGSTPEQGKEQGPDKRKAGEPDGSGAKGAKQTPPNTLEEMIRQALQNNADIRVAETKVAEAEAELGRT